jgi:hypothetical protein
LNSKLKYQLKLNQKRSFLQLKNKKRPSQLQLKNKKRPSQLQLKNKKRSSQLKMMTKNLRAKRNNRLRRILTLMMIAMKDFNKWRVEITISRRSNQTQTKLTKARCQTKIYPRTNKGQ